MSSLRSSLPLLVKQNSSPMMEHQAQDSKGASPDSDASSTCSFDSECLNFIEEHGRRYHSAEMMQPNDNRELELQVIRHEMWRLVCGGELFLLPQAAAFGAHRVLDLGTGLGSWAFDFAAQYPACTVVGVDITPVQPEWVPPNCRFEIDDLREPWTWSEPFDLIHARGLGGSFGLDEFKHLVRQAYDNLKPGGYFEVKDLIYEPRCNDASFPRDSPLRLWWESLRVAGESTGRPMDLAVWFHRLLIEAGFQDVQRVVHAWPTNCWPRQEKRRTVGQLVSGAIGGDLLGISSALLKRGMPDLERDQVVALCENARRDFCNKKFRVYLRSVSVVGRKPGNQ